VATYLTDDELSRLERMTGEAHKPENLRMLTEADLDDHAFMARVKDVYGEAPLDADGTANADYTLTVDLYKAASYAWHQKAGVYAEQFDFEADGGKFTRSQGYHMAIAQAKRYADMASGWAPVDMGVEAV
jgi:hypothetical protein